MRCTRVFQRQDAVSTHLRLQNWPSASCHSSVARPERLGSCSSPSAHRLQAFRQNRRVYRHLVRRLASSSSAWSLYALEKAQFKCYHSLNAAPCLRPCSPEPLVRCRLDWARRKALCSGTPCSSCTGPGTLLEGLLVVEGGRYHIRWKRTWKLERAVQDVRPRWLALGLLARPRLAQRESPALEMASASVPCTLRCARNGRLQTLWECLRCS